MCNTKIQTEHLFSGFCEFENSIQIQPRENLKIKNFRLRLFAYALTNYLYWECKHCPFNDDVPCLINSRDMQALWRIYNSCKRYVITRTNHGEIFHYLLGAEECWKDVFITAASKFLTAKYIKMRKQYLRDCWKKGTSQSIFNLYTIEKKNTNNEQ